MTTRSPSDPDSGPLELAAGLERRLKGRSAQVRAAFLTRPDADAAVPMATRLHQARSKGGLDLRLELTLLWAAGGSGVDPHTGLLHSVRFDAASYAALFGLPDPDGAGKRRIRATLRRLASHNVIEIRPRPGLVPVTVLRDETGSGAAYTRPGEEGQPYVALPAGFWTNGWVNTLHPSAILALLVLSHLEGVAARKGAPLFLAPSSRERRYGFSADTWYAGVADLDRHGFVSRHRQPVRPRFDPDNRSFRDAFFLNSGRLRDRPDQPADPIVGLTEADRAAVEILRDLERGESDLR
jgi:hypothetical protein